ncbi:MAG: BrxA/BrxB family bacilliredoxin [Chitinophagales bacterium]
MYPKELVAPMKSQMTNAGFKELETADAVDQTMADKSGTTFLFFNSVCGCAAGAARPALIDAVKNSKLPNHLVTVFAGVDQEAVSKAREYTAPYPPSSPSMALFKNGELVHFIERHQIEGNNAEAISAHLKKVFDHYC